MVLSQDRHDVVVVGAGPVGVVAAVAHARQGRRVLLLEANPKAAHRFAGEWLHPTGAEILDQLGLGRVPEAGGRPGEGFIVCPDDGTEPVALAYPTGRLGMSVEHGSFVAALRQRAADAPGVDYVEGARVTGWEDGLLTYRDPRDGERTLRPELVIGADGRGSKLREWAGLPGDSVVLSHMASVELRDVALPRENFGYVLLGGPGPVLMYRIADNLIRLCIDVPLAHAEQRNPGFLWDAYHPVFPESLRDAFRRGLADGPVHWAVNRFRPRSLYGADNVRLVGDSVGHFHPLTAAGMTMGFLDADALTRTRGLARYQQARESGSYVPELLSNALYHVFARHDASSASIRSSVFDVWRKSRGERDRTMRILMGAPQGPADFSAAFSRMALSAFGSTVRELTGARRLVELPRALASYRQWLQWPLASLAPRPTRTRYRSRSTPFSAVPLLPRVREPIPRPARTQAAPAPAEDSVPVSTAIERAGEALLSDLRSLVERIGHDPDWLLMRRATRSLAAVEGAELGASMAARLRLGRRAIASEGVSRLLTARASEPHQVDARDIAALLVCLYEVHATEVDAAPRVSEALDVLLAHQKPNGAFAVHAGGPVDLAATHLACRALSAVGSEDERLLPRALRALERARRYLRSQARPDGSWRAQGEHGPVSATALALSALVYAGAPPRSALVARACEWLLQRQSPDGHFVERGRRLVERTDVVTARVLEALSVAHATTPEALENAALRLSETLCQVVVPQLEARQGGDDWQDACVLLDALSAFDRYRRERLLFKPRSRPSPAGDDWAYCRKSLQAVSRTFSKPIAMLPGDLEVAVSCGYLLCRIADTIEDHPAVPRAAKDELFTQFLAVLEHGVSAAPFIEGFQRIEGEDAELDLARNLPRVMNVFGKLPGGMVEAVTRWVCEMARGMSLYTKRDPGEDGFTALLTVGDLERYCFFVAGTVGHMLTDLFEEHAGASLGAKDRADLRTYAEGFGMGLQLVNILKDVTDDRERRWSFVPRAVAERAGTSIEHLVDPDHRERAHRAVAPLFDLAKARLDDAIAYALTIPPHETGVRLFCLLPLWMAALTLKHGRGNDAMFTAGQDVKISRETVQAVIAECAEHVADDAYLQSRYDAMWREEQGEARLA